MNPFEVIDTVIKNHRPRKGSNSYVEKCQNCSWQGWDHDKHVSEEIVNALDLQEARRCVPQIINSVECICDHPVWADEPIPHAEPCQWKPGVFVNPEQVRYVTP